MTSPLHFPWCDPQSCDVDAEGYSAHRSKRATLQSLSHGPVIGELYRVVMPGKSGVTNVLISGIDEKTFVMAWSEWASLLKPRVVSET